jgi:hypothetical protein
MIRTAQLSSILCAHRETFFVRSLTDAVDDASNATLTFMLVGRDDSCELIPGGW